MSDADYITAQTLIRLNRSGNCCEILMSDPVCSDCAKYICNLVSGHAQFSQTIDLSHQNARLQADLHIDSSHKF